MSKYTFTKGEGDVGFGNLSSGSKKDKSKKPTTTKTFNQLVKSLYRSTMMAQAKVEELHIQNFIERYFDEEGKPNYVTLSLPANDGDGSHQVDVDVPLLTLAHNSHLNIKELDVEFEVELGHFEEINEDDISAKVSTIGNKNVAKIKLKLDSDDPPEGIARLRQELNKILPS